MFVQGTEITNTNLTSSFKHYGYCITPSSLSTPTPVFAFGPLIVTNQEVQGHVTSQVDVSPYILFPVQEDGAEV